MVSLSPMTRCSEYRMREDSGKETGPHAAGWGPAKVGRMAASWGFLHRTPLSLPSSTHSLGCHIPVSSIALTPRLPKGVNQKLIRLCLLVHTGFGTQLIGNMMGYRHDHRSLKSISPPRTVNLHPHPGTHRTQGEGQEGISPVPAS